MVAGSYCIRSTIPAITYFQVLRWAIPHHRLYIVSPHWENSPNSVALKSISAPILGDERYGGSVADRTYLHAWRLQFSYARAEYSVEVDPLWGEK